jgi:hypothetical protein
MNEMMYACKSKRYDCNGTAHHFEDHSRCFISKHVSFAVSCAESAFTSSHRHVGMCHMVSLWYIRQSPRILPHCLLSCRNSWLSRDLDVFSDLWRRMATTSNDNTSGNCLACYPNDAPRTADHSGG